MRSEPPLHEVSRYRLAIDVGGTFTDLVLWGPQVGERAYKVSSTPADPALGVINGLATAAADLGESVEALLGATPVILHGTTITTNALLTGNGARTGLIATAGFRDTLAMRKGHRDDQWDSKAAPPPPLVSRELAMTVAGRIDRTGEEIEPLAEDQVVAAAAELAGAGVEAVAVALMFSFLNPAHERRVGEILEANLPGAFVSLSSDIAPQIRLYERTSTAAVNAYVGPILRSYLSNLRQRLAAHGYGGSVHVMQSNGGLAAADTASRHAVTTLLSGPAGGPIASSRVVAPVNVPKAMTIDMGGTSFEASLSRGGETEVRAGETLAGYAITTPALDISTIGAGGGSIAWIDSGGMLRVGPQSAGAEPGPACYARGGTEPTVTDANLLLGYVGASSFGSGELALDVAAAEQAVEGIAVRLGLEQPQAAAGIVAAINAAMADSLRLMTLRRGLDPREFALVAAGGAGPVHAAALAEDLEIPLVVVPRDASVLCASGIQVTELRHDFVRTLFGRSLDAGAVEGIFVELEAEAIELLAEEGVAADAVSQQRVVEVRYLGQVHTIDLVLPPDQPVSAAVIERLREEFHPAHHDRFGHSLVDNEIELVNVRLEARGPSWEAPDVVAELGGEEPEPTSGSRRAWFDGGFVETPVVAAPVLGPGESISGPAMIEMATSTIVVPPAHEVEVHASGSFLLHPTSVSLDSVIDRLYAGGVSV